MEIHSIIAMKVNSNKYLIFKKHTNNKKIVEKSISSGCTSDSECPINQACINKLCQNPCSDSRQCDQNSECRAVNHRPVCVCPIGWSGNPQVQCYKRKKIFFFIL